MKLTILSVCAFFAFCLVSFAQTTETIQIDTYYPAPYGAYAELTTTSNTYLATEGGNVGIGTTSPGAKLEVNGQVKITGGSPGGNKVLTSDPDGLASWQEAGWPQGNYCIIQAQNQSCPTGFTAYDPTSGNFDSARGPIYGGSSSIWESTNRNRADDSSGSYPIRKWAWCCK